MRSNRIALTVVWDFSLKSKGLKGWRHNIYNLVEDAGLGYPRLDINIFARVD